MLLCDVREVNILFSQLWSN